MKKNIVRSESYDGINWSEPETVIFSSECGTWDENVNRASFCVIKGKWFAWYTGQTRDRSCIGFATSENGIQFHKYKTNPVLESTLPFEKNSVMNPCVVWNDTLRKFCMWYACGDKYEPDVIGYAESMDGIIWSKSTSPVFFPSDNVYDSAKVGGCDIVILPNGKYLMFYIGYQNADVARICLATSNDKGKSWIRSEDNPILVPEKKFWATSALYKPTAIIHETEVYLWFNGRKGKSELIGFAKGHIR